MLAHRCVASFALASLFALAAPIANAADNASGSIECEGHKITVKHGWLVRGPNVTWQLEHNLGDLYDPKGKTMLRLYFSDADVSADIKACKNLSCTKDAIKDGFMVDVADPRDLPELPYRIWIVDGDTKYNNLLKPSILTLSTNQPDHLAGKLHIVDALETVKVDVDFDLTVINTVKTEYQLE